MLKIVVNVKEKEKKMYILCTLYILLKYAIRNIIFFLVFPMMPL